MAAKVHSKFVCQNCGSSYAQWLGQCGQCKSWNSLVEEVVDRSAEKRATSQSVKSRNPKPVAIDQIPAQDGPRIALNDRELSRVLGGGLVPGSITLLGGEPGIGKSTLLLQTALRNPHLKTLYVSGEESEHQVKMRAERLQADFKGKGNDANCFVLTETNTQNIFKHIEALQPGLVVIDSVQTLHTAVLDASPGSVGQVRECTAELMRFAKTTSVPMVLIGHITKDGFIAGPKVLEHMVDCVLQFEGDRDHAYRLLRPLKNRFGSTNELGIYEMQGSGLAEVEDPSQVLLGRREERPSGVVVAATMEGMRPLLIEVQALVSTAVYGTPQRSSTGFDLRRLNMLLAVMEKRCGFRLGQKDVFLNLAGGFRVEEPAIDLAVVCAILSSNADIAVPMDVCFAGEVGLTGEIRPVTRTEQRVAESAKLGFARIFVPRGTKGIGPSKGIEVVQVGRVDEVLSHLFG
ncbi:MAG: DNA repair protein RadA [Flavobacteriales bacterium]|jgi:DNA repair protein RadA/Sms|nr:DNA repair protein RadA [Flavobacteriales bacterium]MBK6883340.1 DNA repair protein RadA [Flavobacteriales bacterium]MBK7102982.1 DNA repair protein RadA [Flavobacteriales bacterium]MBK7113916.1 DNA repair protein RadA [Flavobacteriales bacterium]MBK7483151.1 DNA repair protein RadA [Flavobacteriales bacterium]